MKDPDKLQFAITTGTNDDGEIEFNVSPQFGQYVGEWFGPLDCPEVDLDLWFCAVGLTRHMCQKEEVNRSAALLTSGEPIYGPN